MRLNGSQRQQFHSALMGAFSKSELERLVDFHLDESLENITEEGNKADILLDLIKWAERKGHIKKLIDASTEANSTNEPLAEFAKQFNVPPKIATPSSETSPAILLWQERLEFLQVQEVTAVAADQKFAIKKQIEDAKQKIRELSSGTSNLSQVSISSNQTSSPPAGSTSASPIEVFISYSHKDEDLREELDVHLSTLKRQNKIQAWHDRAIEAGTEWETEILGHLESARIMLLLISPRFMASDYCYDKEMQQAMQRHEAGTARVIPIILKPVDWEGTPFRKLKALPTDGKPITTWNNQDAAFLNVVQGIRTAVESLAHA